MTEQSPEGTAAAPAVDQPPPEPTGEVPAPADAIRALGYDPDTVKAIVVTPSAVLAIAADYPEPHHPLEEA